MTRDDRLTPQFRHASLLASVEIDRKPMRVLEQDGLRYLYWGDNALQSVMDVNAPGRVVSPVTAVMLAALVFSPPVLRVLNLGVGAGTVERYFNATDASVELVSVERHAGVVDLARKYFHLADSPVIPASAEHYLHESREHFDVVLCDLFETQRPADCLQSSAFMRQIANALTPERGTAVFNLVAEDQDKLITTLMRIREHLPWTRLANVGNSQNLIVFGRHERPLQTDGQLEKSARTLLTSNAFAPLSFAFSLLEVPDREEQDDPPGRETD